MLSYTGRRDLYGKLSLDSSTDNLALGDILMNNSEKEILSSRQWPFLFKQFTLSTDSSNQFVALPMYVGRVESVYVTVGGTRYLVEECPSREAWDYLNQTSTTSDTPEFFLVYQGKLGIYPQPATSGNTITINSKRLARDLSIADYTTGTIVTATNGGTTIVGSGTSWTANMAGRYIKITDDGANKGDGFWYEIASVTNSTTLVLVRAYGGTSIAAGAATYTIGEMSLLPEPYDMIPVYEALSIYFTSPDAEEGKSDRYANKVKELRAQLSADFGSETQNVVIDPGYGIH